MTQAVFTRVKPFNLVQVAKKQQPQVNVGFLYNLTQVLLPNFLLLLCNPTLKERNVGRSPLLMFFALSAPQIK